MNQKTKKTTQSQTEYLVAKKRSRKKLAIILSSVAVVVATTVVLGLRYTGQALSHYVWEMQCEYDNTETGVAENIAHQHNRFCYSDAGELICNMPVIDAHVHTDDCYVIESRLICGYDEVPSTVADGAPSPMTEETALPEADVPAETPAEAPAEAPAETPAETLAEAPVAFTEPAHLHTEACYEYVKILTCELEETAGMHEHTELCVVQRELTPEEIARLDEARNKYEDGVLTVETEEYIVTVEYTADAQIPKGTELRAEVVPAGDELLGVVEADIEKLNEESEENLEILTTLDIGFYVDGEEIEPAAEVQVSVQFLTAGLEDEELTILHTSNDGESEIVDKQAVDQEGQVSFGADSFSYYTFATVSKPNTTPAAGFYHDQNRNDYEIRYNTMQNAFLSDPAYSKFRISNGALGDVASNFHLVAFGTLDAGTHVNGNILAKKVKSLSNNWGTNAKAYGIPELSYIQEFDQSANIGQMADMGATSSAQHAIVIGDSVNMSLTPSNNGGNELTITSSWMILGQDRASLFVKDVNTATAPFIDLKQVEAEVRAISADLASIPQQNVYRNGSDIILTDPDVCGYINLKASELGGQQFRLYGFSSQSKGSLVINVDCSGQTSFNFPNEANIYIDANVVKNGNGTYSVSGGSQLGTNETVDFTGGKVIWNLINSDGCTIGNIQQLTGAIIAPGASVDVKNMNGTVIAKDIKVTGETHRTDFTGTTVPFSAGFTGSKTVDGKLPVEGQTFKFGLYKWNGSDWGSPIQTVTNSGGNITFTNITYRDGDENKTFWYKMAEIVNSGGTQYTYDTTSYIYKVSVTKSGTHMDATTEQFKVPAGCEAKIQNGNIVIVSGVGKVEPAGAASFDNSGSTEITVEKKWVGADGLTELRDNLPDKLTVQLYKTTDTTKEGTAVGAPVELTAAMGWTYTWKELPQKEGDKELFYYVKETPVDGFELTVTDTVYVKSGIITLTNKKVTTGISLDKKFANAAGDGYLTDKITEGYVKFRLLYSTDGNTWAPASSYNLFRGDVPEITYANGTTVLQATKTDAAGKSVPSDIYTIDASTGWSFAVSNLPKTLSGAVVTYKFEEVESTVPGYLYSETIADPIVKAKLGPTITAKADSEGKVVGYVFTNKPQFTEIDLKKFWQTYTGGEDSIQNAASDAYIIVAFKADGNTEAYYKVTLSAVEEVTKNADGTFSSLASGATPKFKAAPGSAEQWKLIISELPSYKISSGALTGITYSFEELECYNGYVQVGDITVSDDGRSFTLTNKSTMNYELPHTGGNGTVAYRLERFIKGEALN